MRKFEEVKADFADKIAALPPEPKKSYIAYNAGEVLRTTDYSAAKMFSHKGLIETIVPDPIAVKEWRAKRYAINDEIEVQWHKELFEEGGLTDAISKKVLAFAERYADGPDDLTEKFVDLANLVDDCIIIALQNG